MNGIWIPAALAGLALALGGAEEKNEQAERGRELFVSQKCSRCHTVTRHGIEAQVSGAMRGPELGSGPERTASWLRGYVLREEKIDGKAHPLPWKGTESQLDQVVAFLLSLRDEAPEG